MSLPSAFCDAEFLNRYLKLRRKLDSHNELIEKPATYKFLPTITGMTILDLGCGYGDFSKYAADHGAVYVKSIDVSSGMIQLARNINHSPNICYQVEDIDSLHLGSSRFDLVFSGLTLHYISDYEGLVRKIKQVLRPGGKLVFSVEHPIVTAQENGWEISSRGDKEAWRLDSYADEGPRICRWLGSEVLKHHRKIETYVSILLSHGFSITGLIEPLPTESVLLKYPHLTYELKRPPYLSVAATAL